MSKYADDGLWMKAALRGLSGAGAKAVCEAEASDIARGATMTADAFVAMVEARRAEEQRKQKEEHDSALAAIVAKCQPGCVWSFRGCEVTVSHIDNEAHGMYARAVFAPNEHGYTGCALYDIEESAAFVRHTSEAKPDPRFLQGSVWVGRASGTEYAVSAFDGEHVTFVDGIRMSKVDVIEHLTFKPAAEKSS